MLNDLLKNVNKTISVEFGDNIVMKIRHASDGLILQFTRVVARTDESEKDVIGWLGNNLRWLPELQEHQDQRLGYWSLPCYCESMYHPIDTWEFDFGSGVIVPVTHCPFAQYRNSRCLASLKAPFPEWHCRPGYPESALRVTGWPARWAEAHAEMAARGAYKMLVSSYRRLNTTNTRGVQNPERGSHWESPNDHNSQDWSIEEP